MKEEFLVNNQELYEERLEEFTIFKEEMNNMNPDINNDIVLEIFRYKFKCPDFAL